MKEEDLFIPGLSSYMLDLLPERDEVLSELEKIAAENEFPIIGPLTGQFLMIIARLMNAKRILELGSGFGYSALWFAKGLMEEGKIICTEGSEENAEKAREYFGRAGVSEKITFHVGSALDVMDTLDGEFDIIFNDIDKEDYPAAYKAAIPRLRKGGVLITDNTLWSGRILDTSGEVPDHVKGVLEYNRLAFTDPSVLSVILPVRDGLTVSFKL
ncbi:MAG: O-methyltransferase [Candidatus Odinarchaeota archaeon]